MQSLSSSSAGSPHRPRLWKERDAWEAEQVAPCGAAGGLSWAKCLREPTSVPDISDCLVMRPKPFRLVIWEPLETKAPGPHLTSPLCCYINTVIFYVRPYQINRFKRWWRSSSDGLWHESETGIFFEWDQIETRFAWDEKVEYQGDVFVVNGGRVLWAREPGKPNRWWIRRGARRVQR